jgi:hypothetical protein
MTIVVKIEDWSEYLPHRDGRNFGLIEAEPVGLYTWRFRLFAFPNEDGPPLYEGEVKWEFDSEDPLAEWGLVFDALKIARTELYKESLLLEQREGK